MKVKEESEKFGLKLNIQKTTIMASSLITSWQIDGETVETVSDFIFGGSKITVDGDCSHEVKRHSLEEKLWPTGQHIKKQRHYFAKKGSSSQGYGFSSSLVWMWELDYKESWALKNWTVVLEKTLQSPLGCKEIQPVHPKRKSVLSVHWNDWCWSWTNILATWCEELTLLKRMLCWKDWRPEEKRITEDEVVGWRYRHSGQEFDEAVGVDDGQGGLARCSARGCKESDKTELNRTSQHHGLFQWVGFSHHEARFLNLQLQHQPFHWIFRVDFL